LNQHLLLGKRVMMSYESFQSDDGIDAKEKVALQAFNESAQLLTKARKSCIRDIKSKHH